MTKSELKSYILRQLGSPVINIEITPDQLDDVINDALDLFREYHTDALKQQFHFVDLVVGTQDYVLPDTVFSIIDVFGQNNSSIFSFDGEDEGYLMKSAYVGNTGAFGDLYTATDVEVMRQTYAMYRASVRKDYVFDFSELEKTFKLLVDVVNVERLAILTYSYLDDNDKNYSSFWFRKYCVAMAGIKWAGNIKKYIGGSLPGGASFNYADIYDEHNQRRLELEEQILDRYSDSFGMFIG